jgi:hypothetical protein
VRKGGEGRVRKKGGGGRWVGGCILIWWEIQRQVRALCSWRAACTKKLLKMHGHEMNLYHLLLRRVVFGVVLVECTGTAVVTVRCALADVRGER